MLKDTILKFLKLEGLIDNLTGYVEARLQLMKHEIREEVAEAIAHAIVYFVLGLFAFIFVLMGSAAVALFVSQYVGYGWGFTIVAGFYLVLGLIVFASRHSLGETIEERVKKTLVNKKKRTANGNGRSSKGETS